MPGRAPPDPALDPLAATAVATPADVRTAVSHPGPGLATAPLVDVPGYRLDAVIGRGGMGEVLSAHHAQLGRDVAIKRMLGHRPGANEDATARFLREARVQARLDHPAVVPVYELVNDVDGQPCFVMKRIAGTTLAEHLAAKSAGTQRLLRALAEVARAIAYAHQRGVVHRDLKPANIMLGEFGEVYVLDWGVARVLAEAEPIPGGSPSGEPLPDGVTPATAAGAVIGTPGYMAPEQARGEALGPAADVYALGATLWEVLAGAPLHPRGVAGIASTLAGVDEGPAARVPDAAVPPELDALARTMVATAPEARPTARAAADALEHYLDGDRDLETRRAAARDHLATAQAARAEATLDGRARAMREAGRALALDPRCTGAADLITQLLLEPPTTIPEEVRLGIEANDAALARGHNRMAIIGLLAYSTMVPLLLWAGVTSWPWLMAACGAVTVQALIAWLTLNQPMRWIKWANVVASALSIAVLSRLLGPFVIMPGLAIATGVSLLSYPGLLTRPVWVLGILLAAAAAPFALEAAGVWAESWALDGGVLFARSHIIALDGAAAMITLVVLHLALLLGTSLYVRQLALARRDAHAELELKAWQLRQLAG